MTAIRPSAAADGRPEIVSLHENTCTFIISLQRCINSFCLVPGGKCTTAVAAASVSQSVSPLEHCSIRCALETTGNYAAPLEHVCSAVHGSCSFIAALCIMWSGCQSLAVSHWLPLTLELLSGQQQILPELLNISSQPCVYVRTV